ncbi:MAG: hypothetical protein D6768_05285 [Chloroflexi bacterium]|nr:MAG: hypothetical protein D6768_05285 [Chloroflexota bacterium]
MENAVCERSTYCLNFWLAARPTCDECGTLINMNHFHNTRRHYRICHACFERHLPAIAAGSYTPQTLTTGEVRACLNYQKCFARQPFEMYTPKICDHCRRHAPPEHYHDIQKNIRLCLQCYQTLNGDA